MGGKRKKKREICRDEEEYYGKRKYREGKCERQKEIKMEERGERREIKE